MWITLVVNRGVRNLYLDFTEDYIHVATLYTLPRCLLSCTTLVDAKLHCCRGIPSSGKVFLPSLKKLHHIHIEYESLPPLLSGCPVLEHLIIKRCYTEKLNDGLCCVLVSSPTITILDVDLESGFHKLKINAPSLEYLNVKNCYLKDITSLTTMTFLIEADLTLIGDWDVEKRIMYASEVEFINCLCNLKWLKISVYSFGMVVNIAGLDSMVKFDNLTKLDLHLMFDFHEPVKFLEVADNLQLFTFTLSAMHYTYREQRLVPTCMLSYLKTVRINPFNDFNAHDFEMIRYLLRNARVLERMELYSNSYRSSNDVVLEMLRRIQLLERASETCKLAFY